MSFSFGIKAKTKDELQAQFKIELDNVVAGQAIHAKDRSYLTNLFNSQVELVNLNEGNIICVSVSGSLNWTGISGQESEVITGANASINIWQELAK